MSFQITISPNRQAAARFVTAVRRALQKAYTEEQKNGLTQTAIARALGVHRSVINRELRGRKDITLGRVAELAWAMGRVPSFAMPATTAVPYSNIPPVSFTSPVGAIAAGPGQLLGGSTTSNNSLRIVGVTAS
jgi:plasmid maintenance system antidote protein VapI